MELPRLEYYYGNNIRPDKILEAIYYVIKGTYQRILHYRLLFRIIKYIRRLRLNIEKRINLF